MSKEFWLDFRSNRYVGEGPRKCPLCHHAISTNAPLNQNAVIPYAEITFVCPNCDHTFIAYYLLGPQIKSKMPSSLHQLIFTHAKPSEPEEPEIPASVVDISPLFAKTYKEAKRAQELSLLQICGPGYRKAFEFLIKDYAKTKAADNVEKASIETTFSGNVITRHISDARVASVAKRALWLGNDETHYLRRWEEKDLEDLVTLIELTIHWIEMERLSDSYVADMPDAPQSRDGSA